MLFWRSGRSRCPLDEEGLPSAEADEAEEEEGLPSSGALPEDTALEMLRGECSLSLSAAPGEGMLLLEVLPAAAATREATVAARTSCRSDAEACLAAAERDEEEGLRE